ncbi:MAG: anthranilate synthase component I family protein, partial [Desulfovibrio sp.]|nr:anthranilate synthase component I family protein [Desulfovibrio sp.]
MSKEVCVQQSARWLPADMDTPISLFKGMAAEGDGILLESAEVDGRWGRYSVLVCDMALVMRCVDGKLHLDILDKRFDALRVYEGGDFVSGLRSVIRTITLLPPSEIADLPPITRALYGYFGFGAASLFSEKLAKIMPKSEANVCLVLPRTTLVFDHLYNRLCQISLGDHRTLVSARDMPESAPLTGDFFEVENLTNAEPDAAGYKDWVEKIKAMLRAGEAIQVVPSVRFHYQFRGDTFAIYRRMRRFNASPYMFYMRLPGITLFGSSPEVMVGSNNGTLTVAPIAGTRRRGRDEREDQFFASELLKDPKERAEHVMLVDLGRNDLGRIAKPGSVMVERYMQVERFSHVMHLTSRVSAKLKQGLDALDVLGATFPAGTVSGAPKIRAMEIIRSLEGRGRGPYAGCIGWLGLDHDAVNLDLGITIRSMWREEDQLFWQAGGGIVHDSDPDLEWKEVC